MACIIVAQRFSVLQKAKRALQATKASSRARSAPFATCWASITAALTKKTHPSNSDSRAAPPSRPLAAPRRQRRRRRHSSSSSSSDRSSGKGALRKPPSPPQACPAQQRCWEVAARARPGCRLLTLACPARRRCWAGQQEGAPSARTRMPGARSCPIRWTASCSAGVLPRVEGKAVCSVGWQAASGAVGAPQRACPWCMAGGLCAHASQLLLHAHAASCALQRRCAECGWRQAGNRAGRHSAPAAAQASRHGLRCAHA